MKELSNKIIQISTTILISWIVVYGNVNAQQVCCSTILNICTPTFNKISVSYTSDYSFTTSPSHQRTIRLESFICSENYSIDFGAGNTCCETDGCDSYNRPTVFSISFSQDLYSLQKVESIFDAGNGGQTKLKPDTLLISFKAAPIYILTQSIIC